MSKARLLKVKKINLKVLFVIILLISSSIVFIINSWIIGVLRSDLEQKVDNFANSYKSVLEKVLNDSFENPNSNTNDINFFQDHFVKSIDFPLIFCLEGVPVMSQPPDLKNSQNIAGIMRDMSNSFEPIDIKIFNKEGSLAFEYKLYYGDPDMLSMIKIIPYVELLIALAFVFFMAIFYYISKKNAQNALYLGISKETAHQLGTPISSLLGWFDYVKRKGVSKKVISYIDEDIDRLKKVSERFSKIGSRPSLSPIGLKKLLNDIVVYSQNRVPSTKKIIIKMECYDSAEIYGNETLLSWAFENLIKNSIDSIKSSSGEISIIVIDKSETQCVVEFIDSGIGIARKYWKKIFTPGYTTKARGWGVGLSLTSRIIKDIHSGRIYVSSSTPGRSSIKILLNKVK